MSAVNFIVQEKRGVVTMAVDGAAYHRKTCVMVKRVRKGSVVGGHTAVASTGPHTFGSLVAMVMEGAPSFDAALLHAPHAVREVFKEITEDFSDDDDGVGEVFFAGYSDRERKPAVYSVVCCRDGMTDGLDDRIKKSGRDCEPFALHRMDAFGGTPHPAPDLVAASGVRPPASLAELERLDPKAAMLWLLEMQRQTPASRYGGRFIVGGHVQLITIDRSGVVAAEIVQGWPDTIGRVIDPAPMDWNAWRDEHWQQGPVEQFAGTNVITMNRQQRRAATRQARA